MGFLSKMFGGKGSKYEVADIYRELRDQVLAQTGETGAGNGVRAFVMDSGMGDACYTLMAAEDGSLSLYFSNGGGVIGAGERPRMGAITAAFVEETDAFREQLEVVSEVPLPGPGQVRLTLVTAGALLSAEFPEDDLGNNRLPLSPLFHRAHHLIAMVREIDEMKNEPPLVFACWDNDAGEVARQLGEGADPGTVSSEGLPAVGVAVRSGAKEVVEVLLRAGVDPATRITSADGSLKDGPLLCLAAAQGNVDILGMLLAAGAPIDAQESTGLSALHMAAFMGEGQVVRCLLDRGANSELREETGCTPLMMAANAGKEESVRLLLERGADVSAIDENQCTALMFAAQHGYEDSVGLLLAKGADPAFKCAMNLSAIDFAAQNGHTATIALLAGGR